MVPPNHILEAKKKELMKLQAAGDAIKAELVTEEKKTADLAADAKKRKAGEEKRRVNMVHIAISCPEGLVARCQIPTEAVIQLGLFRILLGSMSVTNIAEKTGPYGPPIGPINVGVPDWQPSIGQYDSYGLVPQDGGNALLLGSATGFLDRTH